MNALLTSHNGLGDNLFMIGALHYLLKFYTNVFFICKKKYYENIKLFFNTPNIICIFFDDTKNEWREINNIIIKCYPIMDVFVCGEGKRIFKSKITNHKFLTHKVINNNDIIKYDTLDPENYKFIEDFYKDAKLNLTIFYDYFKLPNTNESKNLYNSVKKYYLVFIQSTSSCGKCLNITNLLKKYLNDDNTLLICNDKNLYDKNNDKFINKHDLCKPFVLNNIINYVDLIENCNEIYIIDSCFTGIMLPFIKQKKLKANPVRIIRRELISEIKI